MEIKPFTITVSPFVIEDLRERLGRARWPDEISGAGWEYGTNLAYLRELCTHWGHGFDWKEQEALLNELHHFQAHVDGFCLHFIHEKGGIIREAGGDHQLAGGDHHAAGSDHHAAGGDEAGAGVRRIPILLIHGWPDSFVRFLKLIPLLTGKGARPEGRDRESDVVFDVIVPSIPGFGFSEKPTRPGMNTQKVAALFAGLMDGLGYDKFLVHGGDMGSKIGEELAAQFPERVMGLHLTEVPYQHLFGVKPEELRPAEKTWLATGQKWQQREGAFNLEQSTKPQTLAYALNDSPVGLAAWIIEKFHSWSDCDGDLESVYTRDELLTNLSIYWITQTAGSAARIYYEEMHHPRKISGEKLPVPAAFYISAKDLVPAPREFAERVFNVKQWTQPPHGGHFAAMEEPGLLAEDIFRFAESYAGEPVTA